jgi:hypothetical protein
VARLVRLGAAGRGWARLGPLAGRDGAFRRKAESAAWLFSRPWPGRDIRGKSGPAIWLFSVLHRRGVPPRGEGARPGRPRSPGPSGGVPPRGEGASPGRPRSPGPSARVRLRPAGEEVGPGVPPDRLRPDVLATQPDLLKARVKLDLVGGGRHPGLGDDPLKMGAAGSSRRRSGPAHPSRPLGRVTPCPPRRRCRGLRPI